MGLENLNLDGLSISETIKLKEMINEAYSKKVNKLRNVSVNVPGAVIPHVPNVVTAAEVIGIIKRTKSVDLKSGWKTPAQLYKTGFILMWDFVLDKIGYLYGQVVSELGKEYSLKDLKVALHDGHPLKYIPAIDYSKVPRLNTGLSAKSKDRIYPACLHIVELPAFSAVIIDDAGKRVIDMIAEMANKKAITTTNTVYELLQKLIWNGIIAVLQNVVEEPPEENGETYKALATQILELISKY